MAGRERVLLVTGLPRLDARLEATVTALRARRAWPYVLALADPAGEGSGFIAQLAALGAQGSVVEDPDAAAALDAVGRIAELAEADAIVVTADGDVLGTLAASAARRAAEDLEIPLWVPAAVDAQRGDRTIGETVFTRVPLPRPSVATRTPWMATVGTALLAAMATVAGTFSYLAAPPVGLLLSAIAVLGLLLGARLLHASRAPATAAAIVSLVTLGVLAVDPFGGAQGAASVLIPATPLGWSWIGVVALGGFLALVVPDFAALRGGRVEDREGVAS